MTSKATQEIERLLEARAKAEAKEIDEINKKLQEILTKLRNDSYKEKYSARKNPKHTPFYNKALRASREGNRNHWEAADHYESEEKDTLDMINDLHALHRATCTVWTSQHPMHTYSEGDLYSDRDKGQDPLQWWEENYYC